jgi:signal transduction histidine kinase
MIYQFTINTLIHLLTAIAAFVTIAFLWKFKKSPEAKYLIILEFLVGLWAITYAFELSSPILETKIFWSKLSYFGIAFLPVLYFLFTSVFSQKKHTISTEKIALLLIVPIATLVLVVTNDMHHLIWTSVTLDPTKNIAQYSHGAGFWVFFVYAEVLLFLGIYNLLHALNKFQVYHKKQSWAVLIASVIPVIGNLMYVTNINPVPYFDWTPLSFVLTGLIVLLSIFRLQMFQIVPLARTQLYEGLNDGIIVVNSNGNIEDCNQAIYSIFNWHNKSIVNEPFNTIFESFEEMILGMASDASSFRLALKQGENSNYYQIKKSPIYTNKKLWGYILLFHDITSIIKVDEDLKSTNKKLLLEIEKREKLIEDLDAFAHTVAHDLRNSLSSIFSASEIMEEIIKINDKNLLCELSNLINHSANKSIQITHELLLLATTDKTEVELKPIDMALVFGEAKNQNSDLINNSHALLKEPETWPQAIGYAPWIEEVWSNYISNAIKYGGTPPVLEVGAEPLADGRVKFSIKDNGKGLTPDEQKKLFNNFVRLSPQKADGYGLGLSIVKKIIEKLNGTVGVESNGDGSIFYFILPSTQQSPITLHDLKKTANYTAN